MSGMNKFLNRMRTLLIDFAHGVNAGNAIRHGLLPSSADQARTNRY